MSLYAAEWRSPLAWVFGAEGQGVRRALLDKAGLKIRDSDARCRRIAECRCRSRRFACSKPCAADWDDRLRGLQTTTAPSIGAVVVCAVATVDQRSLSSCRMVVEISRSTCSRNRASECLRGASSFRLRQSRSGSWAAGVLAASPRSRESGAGARAGWSGRTACCGAFPACRAGGRGRSPPESAGKLAAFRPNRIMAR